MHLFGTWRCLRNQLQYVIALVIGGCARPIVHTCMWIMPILILKPLIQGIRVRAGTAALPGSRLQQPHDMPTRSTDIRFGAGTAALPSGR